MRTGALVCIIMKGRNNALFSDISERCMLTLSSMEEDAIIDVIDEDGDEIEEALRLIRNNNPKGIIFLGANLGLFDERMKEIEIPCVIATTSAVSLEWKNVSSVSVDDETATSEGGSGNYAVVYLTIWDKEKKLLSSKRFDDLDFTMFNGYHFWEWVNQFVCDCNMEDK